MCSPVYCSQVLLASLHSELVPCVMCRLLEPKLQRSIATSVARGMAHLHSRSPPILHLVGLPLP